MKTKQLLAMAGMALVMSLGAGTLLAQNNDNSKNGDNSGQGRKRGGGNFDPSQFQQRMMDNYKERLEITDDTEWNAIKPLIQKVMDARFASMRGGMGGMFGGRNRGGDSSGGSSDQSRGRGGPGGMSSPEADALRKAIDSKASNSELKTAVAKYVEARKTKQAE